VHLNKLTTGVYTNRFTTLTRTINTLAPAQTLTIYSPETDGEVLYLTTNGTYTIQSCFTSSLASTNATPFSVCVNGVLQPRTTKSGTALYSIGESACGFGLSTLNYNWTGAAAGTNIIEVVFTNSSLTLTATRQVLFINPSFGITTISGGQSGETIVWSSYSNLNYQVQATTNLNLPFTNLSGVIPGNGASSFFFDTNPDPVSKFYRVVIVP